MNAKDYTEFSMKMHRAINDLVQAFEIIAKTMYEFANSQEFQDVVKRLEELDAETRKVDLGRNNS